MLYLLTLIGCCLFVVYGALIEYYRQAWNAIPSFDSTGKQGRTRISVLIPARNEAINIVRCINSLARQSYPKDLYQVIVIDDHSTDSTGEIVASLHPTELFLTYTRLTDTTGKKIAIETGVGLASGELIVTTDADCSFHANWLNSLALFYEENDAKFIAAPVRMGGEVHPSATSRSLLQVAPPSSPLAIFQTLDFITLQGITGAAVHRRIHSMCNGANLAYEKSAFLEVGGFMDIDDIPSGDDMLLMHKIYTRYPEQVFFLKSRQAIVTTQPETRWKSFIDQRVRWASKADRYDDKRIFYVLLLVYFVNALFLFLALAACWNLRWLWLLAAALLLKTLVEYPLVHTVSGFFGQRRLIGWFPILQPFHILYTVIIGWMGKFGSYHWKDRVVKK
jgi:cellulose synthase/poly-beta-1,6-N-acetylglucosamine synthase-like glycosyltransferase